MYICTWPVHRTLVFQWSVDIHIIVASVNSHGEWESFWESSTVFLRLPAETPLGGQCGKHCCCIPNFNPIFQKKHFKVYRWWWIDMLCWIFEQPWRAAKPHYTETGINCNFSQLPKTSRLWIKQVLQFHVSSNTDFPQDPPKHSPMTLWVTFHSWFSCSSWSSVPGHPHHHHHDSSCLCHPSPSWTVWVFWVVAHQYVRLASRTSWHSLQRCKLEMNKKRLSRFVSQHIDTKRTFFINLTLAEVWAEPSFQLRKCCCT